MYREGWEGKRTGGGTGEVERESVRAKGKNEKGPESLR